MTDDTLFILWFSRHKLGITDIRKLLITYGTARRAFIVLTEKGAEALQELAPPKRQALAEAVKEVGTELEELSKYLSSRVFDVYDLTEDEYPNAFAIDGYTMPSVIFTQGIMPPQEGTKCIAILGARQATDGGLKIATDFAEDLAVSYGFTVMNGLMPGVELAAQKRVLSSQKPTVAVVACDIESLYTGENKEVCERIVDLGGTIISASMPGQGSRPYSFKQRNNMLRALNQNLFVAEAGAKSKSLKPIDAFTEYKRNIFGVMSGYGENSNAGVSNLIVKGIIRPVLSAKDIADAVGVSTSLSPKSTEQIREEELYKWSDAPKKYTHPDGSPLNSAEEEIVELMKKEPVSSDTLFESTKLTFKEITVSLQMLEFYGISVSIPGGFYKLKD